MDTLIRALAYATLVYWIRTYLDGLTAWDSILTGRMGGWIARCEVEGRGINAEGKSLEGICWCPIDTREQALDLVAFLKKVGADANLQVAYLQAEAQLIRDPLAPVAGWPAIAGLFGNDGKQGIRRAFRAGLDLDIVERMSEQYVFDVSTQGYLDRDRLLKGLSYDIAHDRLIRKHEPDAVFIGKKRVNPFRLYAASQLRTDVAVSDMYPGAEPGAILRCSPVYGLLKDEEAQPDEYKFLNIYRGFAIKPIGAINPALMAKVVSMLDKMLGLLTRDNDAQMDWLKKFIAFTIQHPEIKQQIAPVIIGGQGIGKTLFGNTFMRALFGELSGHANAAGLENNFLITPFVGKLMVYIDEVKIGSAAAINEVKKLVRESIISGEFKFKDRKDYRIFARLILTANHADIGLNPEDAADRALFFIVSWTAENRKLSKQDFNAWTGTLKPFYSEFADMLEKVDVRQHLMRYFMDIACTRAELEDLTHSSRDDENVVKATMSKARHVARRIAASGRIIAGNDLTAWFTTHHLRTAIFREDGQRSRIEMQGCPGRIRTGWRDRAGSGRRGRLLQIQIRLRQNSARNRQGPRHVFSPLLGQGDQETSMSIPSCRPSIRRRGAATRSGAATAAGVLSMLLITSTSTTSEAHCYAIWHYPWGQHCAMAASFTPLSEANRPQPKEAGFVRSQSEQAENKSVGNQTRELDAFVNPGLEVVDWGVVDYYSMPVERIRGIAFLRALSNVP